MSAETRILVLMARRPAYGRGKRRLAVELGDLTAHRFQRFGLECLLRRFGEDRRWRLWLALTPDTPPSYLGARRVVPQGGGDLGARIVRLSRRLPPGRVVFIGSDALDASRRDVAAAFGALGKADCVLGPAPDGGYWLIGFTQAQRRRLNLSEVRWSTPQTRADTLNCLVGRRVGLLRELEDVDDAASHGRWRKRAGRPGG